MPDGPIDICITYTLFNVLSRSTPPSLVSSISLWVFQDLRVTLVWTDPPAQAGASDVLIHDLDLTVIAQSTGNVYYPNGLSEADSVNNVEKVTVLDATELETYTIRVRWLLFLNAVFCGPFFFPVE